MSSTVWILIGKCYNNLLLHFLVPFWRIFGRLTLIYIGMYYFLHLSRYPDADHTTRTSTTINTHTYVLLCYSIFGSDCRSLGRTESPQSHSRQDLFYHLCLGIGLARQDNLYRPRSHSLFGRARRCLYTSCPCHVQSMSILQTTRHASLSDL